MTGLYIQCIVQTRDCKLHARFAIRSEEQAAIASPFGFVAPLMFVSRRAARRASKTQKQHTI